MIEFTQVCAGYADDKQILHDLSFTISESEFVAFAGTNGAGKSTAMRLINGLLKPTSGEVLIDGVPTTQLKTSQLAERVGFLFQNPDRQICCNTVREELLFGFKAQNRLDAEAEERVAGVIEHFGFDGDAEPYLLNRGTRQLLALASVIVMDPPVVVLDEPTTGLDYRECCKVMDAIADMHARGTTVIMVCHDMEVVADYAHRIIAMTDGRIVADGPTFAILRDLEVLERAHLLRPQIVEIAMEIEAARPDLADSPIVKANDLASMHAAFAAYVEAGE